MSYSTGPSSSTIFRTPGSPVGQDPHVQALAVIRLVLGCLGLPLGLGIFALCGGIGLMAGASGGRDAAAAMGVMTLFGLIIGGFLTLLAVPSLVVGLGLLKRREWARIFALILGVLDLFNFPLGTALGVYSLWALLRPEAMAEFNRTY